MPTYALNLVNDVASITVKILFKYWKVYSKSLLILDICWEANDFLKKQKLNNNLKGNVLQVWTGNNKRVWPIYLIIIP